jgi:hypothetical protein
MGPPETRARSHDRGSAIEFSFVPIEEDALVYVFPATDCGGRASLDDEGGERSS